MNQNKTMSNDEEFINYRLDKLEKSIDAIITSLSPVQFTLQNEKINTLSVRMEKMESAVDEIKSFMFKAIGALTIISLIIQLVAPILIDAYKNKDKHTVEFIEK